MTNAAVLTGWISSAVAFVETNAAAIGILLSIVFGIRGWFNSRHKQETDFKIKNLTNEIKILNKQNIDLRFELQNEKINKKDK
jgi:hypothetical protein